MYLKRSSSILFQILSKKLNYPFKKKDEQKFIYRRLDLLYWHYCLEVDLQLWQSYLDIGLQHNRWPVSLFHENYFKFYFIFAQNHRGTTLYHVKNI